MLNLTASTIALFPEGSDEPISLAPTTPSTASDLGEQLILSGEQIPIGHSKMNVATLGGASERKVRQLNKRVEEQIRRDRDTNGGSGLVLVDRRVLQHIDPRLAAHVAAAHPEPPLVANMLIRPPMPDEANGYTLYLDRPSSGTSNPDVIEIGRANTWQQLQWMAAGAAPFKNQGRLWALNNGTRDVMSIADIHLEQEPRPTTESRQ